MIFFGDSVGGSGIPREVCGVCVVLGKEEPSVSLMDVFIFVLESVSKEFDGYVTFFLSGVFHPISSIFWGCLDKVCFPRDMREEVWSLSAVYFVVNSGVVAKVD